MTTKNELLHLSTEVKDMIYEKLWQLTQCIWAQKQGMVGIWIQCKGQANRQSFVPMWLPTNKEILDRGMATLFRHANWEITPRSKSFLVHFEELLQLPEIFAPKRKETLSPT